jgi:hypothetical protein
MPAKYARIPGRNVLSAILQSIPIKCRGTGKKPVTQAEAFAHCGGRTTKTALKAMQCAPVIIKSTNQTNKQITKMSSTVAKAIAKLVTATTKVYVLELYGGYIYVGQSSNVQRRVSQHMQGRGAAFTKRHKPTGIILPRLGNIEGAGDSGERQEVLLQMRMRGMQHVRGWKYVKNSLSATDVMDIKSNWIEMFNLCRICMGEGHMASSCKKRKR